MREIIKSDPAGYQIAPIIVTHQTGFHKNTKFVKLLLCNRFVGVIKYKFRFFAVRNDTFQRILYVYPQK